MNRRHKQKGFSLIEMMVVVAIVIIVMGAVFRQVANIQKRSRNEEVKIDMIQQARESLDQMIRDLHQAGYPNSKMYSAGVLTTPVNNNVTLAVGLVKIINGTTAMIIFEGDVDGDGQVDSVQYRLVTSSTESNHCPCIERSQVTKTAADPLTGQGTAFHLAVENVASSGLVFTAYDANGALVSLSGGLTITSNAAALASIKTLSVTLNTQGQYPDLATKQFPAATLTGLAQIKN